MATTDTETNNTGGYEYTNSISVPAENIFCSAEAELTIQIDYEFYESMFINIAVEKNTDDSWESITGTITGNGQIKVDIVGPGSRIVKINTANETLGIDRIRIWAAPVGTSGRWPWAMANDMTAVHNSTFDCGKEDITTEVSQTNTSSGYASQSTTETNDVPPVTTTTTTSDVLPPVTTTTTTSNYIPPPVVSNTETEGDEVAYDGSFLDLNCGVQETTQGMCCTSPTQTNNAVILENTTPTVWASAKRFFPQASSVDITSCDLQPPKQVTESCNSFHTQERMSIYRPDYIPGWFHPTQAGSLRDIRAINGPDEGGYTASPRNYDIRYNDVDYNVDIFNDTEQYHEGHTEPKAEAADVITFTCEADGDLTAIPPGASGWHKRDFTDGLTSKGDGMAKKTPVADGLELSTDFNADYFTPKYNEDIADYVYTGKLTDQKVGVRVIEGAWDKSTEYYTTDMGGTYIEPLTYKSIFDREFFEVTDNLVENWKAGDTDWNTENLNAFGFEYMVQATGGLVGDKSRKAPSFGGTDNTFRSASSEKIYVSEDGKIALMYSITAGWQFVDTLGGFPITVILPEDATLFDSVGQHGPRRGEHENGRLNITYHTGVIHSFEGDGTTVDLSANDDGDVSFSTDLSFALGDEGNVTGTLNNNEITFELTNDYASITNGTSGDSVMWSLSEDNNETGRHMPLRFVVNDDEPYNVNFVFLGTTTTESNAASIQSEQTTEAVVSSNTIPTSGLADDPHLTTFFGEKYNM
jgi:hypothetical protein